MDIRRGHYEVFFLQNDAGHLRAIYDSNRHCILWLRTGAQSHYQINPNSSIPEIITDLLLSRGDRTTDAEMVDAIYHPDVPWAGKLSYRASKA